MKLMWFFYIFIITWVDITSAQNNLCEYCKCIFKENNILEIHCVYLKSIPAIEKIKWPNNETIQNIAVYFHNSGLQSIPRLPESTTVTSLNFTDNEIKNIEPYAFSNLKHLKYLCLSNNMLNEINPDILHNLNELEILDLSENKFTIFNEIDFLELTNLKQLFINNNMLTTVPLEALSKLNNLQYLNLAENGIYFLGFSNKSHSFKYLEKIKILDASNNKLTVIVKESFQMMTSLEELYLSNNNIANIDIGTFEECNFLKILDLSFNNITKINSFPSTLEVINLRHNGFKDWPDFPNSLKVLDVSENKFYKLFNDDTSLDVLEVFSISRNELIEFDISKPLPNLKILDLSFNFLGNIPKYLNVINLPNLEILNLDNNPLRELFFEEEITLNVLYANYLSKITVIKDSFLKIKQRNTESMGELLKNNMCIRLWISNCKNLIKIEDGAFYNIPLCYLDISNNNLTELSEDTANWLDIQEGVNIQGNPWNCMCNLQWILDVLLDFLYKKHSVLLHELRCNSPRNYKGLRFVHWYSYESKAFCESDLKKSSNYILQNSISTNKDGLQQKDIIVLLLFGGIILVSISIIGLCIYLVKISKSNVRRTNVKKRQTNFDRINKIKNKNIHDENVILT